jgi:predicted kinase
MSSAQPTLIVVTGRPGSGKTTLTRDLARAVRCPLISRDQIKEGLVNTIGPSGHTDEIAWQAYQIFFDTIEALLQQQVTLIAEAAFQHKLWAPRLQPLSEIASLRIIVCNVDSQVAHSRCVARNLADPARERIHPPPTAPSDYDPPHLDVPTITVDTSNGYRPAFEQIVAFAQS